MGQETRRQNFEASVLIKPLYHYVGKGPSDEALNFTVDLHSNVYSNTSWLLKVAKNIATSKRFELWSHQSSEGRGFILWFEDLRSTSPDLSEYVLVLNLKLLLRAKPLQFECVCEQLPLSVSGWHLRLSKVVCVKSLCISSNMHMNDPEDDAPNDPPTQPSQQTGEWNLFFLLTKMARNLWTYSQDYQNNPFHLILQHSPKVLGGEVCPNRPTQN